MATINVFVSFEFDKDNDLKNNFYQQAKTESRHTLRNFSINEPYREDNWQQKARAEIERCDVMIILIGPDTHNAQGVKTEVRIARRLSKPIFQVKPQKRNYSGVADVDVVRGKWKQIDRKLDDLFGR